MIMWNSERTTKLSLQGNGWLRTEAGIMNRKIHIVYMNYMILVCVLNKFEYI